MSEDDKAEWIDERACIIWESERYNGTTWAACMMLARRLYEESFGGKNG